MGKSNQEKHPKENEIELVPDAWERFERAAEVVVKSPPQHREGKAKKTVKRRASSSKPKSASRVS